MLFSPSSKYPSKCIRKLFRKHGSHFKVSCFIIILLKMYLTWQTLFWKYGWFLSNFKILHRANFQLTQQFPPAILTGRHLQTFWNSAWYHSFHLDIQTSSLDTIFPAFSLLHTLDIHWNFWEMKCLRIRTIWILENLLRKGFAFSSQLKEQ